MQNTKIEKKLMKKIENNEIKIKSKWVFYLASGLILSGLVFSFVTFMYFVNLVIFYFSRTHYSTMWQYRLLLNLQNFPFYILLVAIFALIGGLYLIKKYDFSYKLNYLTVVLIFVILGIFSAVIFNFLGLNDFMEKRGLMKDFYNNGRGNFQNRDVINKVYPKNRRVR